MRRGKLFIVLALLQVCLAGSAGCALLDAVFGAALRSDEELCAASRALEARQNEDGCGETTIDCAMLECGRSKAGGACSDPWDQLLSCLFDEEHDCGELQPDEGYCTAAFERFLACEEASVCDTRCADDTDCGGGICGGLNGLFCSLDGSSPSCSSTLTRETQCRVACAADADCPAAVPLCVEVDPTDEVSERGCEEARCTSTSDCGAGFVCAQPLSMQIDVPGFCLPDCDPLSCSGDLPGSCACDPVVSQCAPAFDDDGIVGYACTMAGDVKAGGACAEPGDCASGTICFDGSCAPYCDVAAQDCASGAPCVAIGPAGGAEGACREACDEDTVCEATELAGCVDCDGVACDRDEICEDGEGQRCGDCVRRCAAQGDCAKSETCSDLNADLCGADDTANCDLNLPSEPVCRLRCTNGSQCGDVGFVCADTDLAAEVTLQACEPGRCTGTTSCAAGACVDPSLLVPVISEFVGGLCLPACDPTACATGGQQCPCGPSNERCAPLRDATTLLVDFVCTSAGQGGVGDVCTDEASCGLGQACFEGFCRAYCDDTGVCANVCQTLDAAQPDVRVCVP